MRVKCLAQEHNTMSPARARTQAPRSRVLRTNHHEAAIKWHILLTVADEDLELREGVDLLALLAFLPFCHFFFLPKIKGPGGRPPLDQPLFNNG